MAAAKTELKSWERMPGESETAYAAFLSYLEMKPRRSFVGAARLVGKHESLIRRWAERHRWRERAWAWDVHQSRQDESVIQQQREAVLRERLEDIDRMSRACLAFFRTLVRRDPESGEVVFDTRFTPQVALRFLELALRAQGVFDRKAPEEESDERSAADLFGLADAELMEMIDLARERADQQDQRKENGNESDQGNTQQKQHEEDPAEGD